MKLFFACMACFRKIGEPTGEYFPLEIRDDGFYQVVCPRKHRDVTVLQQQRFEVLFELGAHAILDGYYREAISSFSASLERFYEVCVDIFSSKAGAPAEELEKAWKEVSAQS